jgi:hypothetical protein
VLRVCLLNSHRWLHTRLTEHAAGSPVAEYATDPETADIVIHPVPPAPDPGAPQRHHWLRPDLWPRLFLFSQDDRPVPWAPGVFASVAASHPDAARVRGGFYVAEASYLPEHACSLVPRASWDAEFLWCFVGSAATWPAIRGPLLALRDPRAMTRDTDAFHRTLRWQVSVERSRALASYAESLHRAQFVVCPRGKSPSSIRLFEAMRVGRCPVIVSDDWLAPPFVDWSSCSVRIAERDLPRLPDILREREPDARALGVRARSVWEQRYSPAAMLKTLTESCLDIAAPHRRVAPRLTMIRRAATARPAARRLRTGVRRVLSG